MSDKNAGFQGMMLAFYVGKETVPGSERKPTRYDWHQVVYTYKTPQTMKELRAQLVKRIYGDKIAGNILSIPFGGAEPPKIIKDATTSDLVRITHGFIESGLGPNRTDRWAGYQGNPGGGDIYPNEIAHGYGEPLAGGTDVMRRLQNTLLHEQGNDEWMRPESPRLASIDETLKDIEEGTDEDIAASLEKLDVEKEARFTEGVSADPTENMSEEDAKVWKEMNELHGDKFKTASMADQWGPVMNALAKLKRSNPSAARRWEDEIETNERHRQPGWFLKEIQDELGLKMAAVQMLLPQAIKTKIPKLYSQEKIKDPIVWVKFFSPYNNWTWLVTEFDGNDTFFGLVKGFETELGYFSLRELQNTKFKGVQAVERDTSFRPMPLSQAKTKEHMASASEDVYHDERMSKFEEGVSADPTENMSPEDAKEWKENTETYGDKFKTASRRISEIAREIAQDWRPVSPYARPYLSAMFSLNSINDDYYDDSGTSIVAYFLSNASSWRGEVAKRVKKELNDMLKSARRASSLSQPLSTLPDYGSMMPPKVAESCPDNLDESACNEWEKNTDKYQDKFKTADETLRELQAALHRPLHEIAQEIRRDWRPVNFAAKPYLEAMSELNLISDRFYQDSAASIVAYFLSNATSWRGEVAKRVKLELKGMLKGAHYASSTDETLRELEAGMIAPGYEDRRGLRQGDFEPGHVTDNGYEEGEVLPGNPSLEGHLAQETPIEGKFEKDAPADPTENMSEEDKSLWMKYHGKIEEVTKTADEKKNADTSALNTDLTEEPPSESASTLPGDKDPDRKAGVEPPEVTEEDAKKWDAVSKKATITNEFTLQTLIGMEADPDDDENDANLKVTGAVRAAADRWEDVIRRQLMTWVSKNMDKFNLGNPIFHRKDTRSIVDVLMVHDSGAGFLYYMEMEGAGIGTKDGGWDKLFQDRQDIRELSTFMRTSLRSAYQSFKSAIEDAASEARPLSKQAASGLYGFTRGIQSDCDGACKKLSRAADALAKEIYRKDEKTSEFLVQHAKRAQSIPAELLVASLRGMAPKIASGKLAEFSLTPADKKVIDAFIDQRSATSKALSSDGKVLDGLWMGGKKMAEWMGGSRIQINDNGGKSTDVIARYLKKTAPANLLKTASMEVEAAKTGLYGFHGRTAKIGLQACTDLRHEAGRIANDLHLRRKEHHAKITGFFQKHAEEGGCLYSKMMGSCYPEASAKMASTAPKTVNDWINQEV